MRLQRTVRIILIAFVVMAVRAGVAHAAKINLTPSSLSISEGTSQVVHVSLSEPIITSGPDPAYVTLNFTSDTPSRVSISPSSVTWLASEWMQTRDVTISAIDDDVRNFDVTPTFSIVADSNSEYYSNFAPQLTATILDNETSVEVPSVLPAVGVGVSSKAALVAFVLALLIVLASLRNRYKRY